MGDHGHDHSHDHSAAARRGGARFKGRLAAAFAIGLGFLILEVVAGFLTDSLALLSDAGHMLTDVIGLGMALAAIHLADRKADADRHTYGLYRAEILAALANTVLLFGVALYVVWEAIGRLRDPAEVLSGPMLVVAVAGLGANIVSFFLLREGAGESLNIHGAYLEVMADAIGSVGVIIAALIMGITGWPYADPIAAAAIGLFILPRTYRLGRRAVRILLQSTPEGLDLAQLRADLEDIPGVVDVHDLHAWTLTSGMDVVSAHVMTEVGVDSHAVLDTARHLLEDRHQIAHATLQVEPSDHRGCDEVDW